MIMKKIDYKKLILFVVIPLFLGGIVGFITSKESMNYDGIIPGWVFPVVWSILYILMGISSFIISDDNELLNIYKVNLIVNLLWPIIFFSFGFKVFAFFWLLLLILIVGYMIYRFYNKNKISGYLLIPYMLWIIFASILNLMEII